MADQEKPSIYKVFTSAIAALFGVQSQSNHQRDFGQSSPWPFIIAGVVAISCFVGGLLGVTWLVTH
ncbi:DUF2970 domain-containing protein [Photobacterium sanguinicancri]|uniref:DUF2970 domain-containing protein n=1 Tax=Photobacterium sanguinicancri TaxID=875932 RepID=A0ABX4FXM7_9GAMM|nr:DUF2970 domain-containing protein [Photobacterium sanguinicancri]OZS43647.1 hypothetical protein ASV53_12085 [Photobacterium sanguinicancri]